MTNYSPVGGYPYPSLSDVPNIQTWGQQLTSALDSTTLPHFASDSAVSSALASPSVGQCIMRTDVAGGTIMSWNGSRWVAVGTQLIGEWVASANTNASVEFGSIPQYWRHLRLYISAKAVYNGGAASFGFVGTTLQFNSDSSPSYDYVSISTNDGNAAATAGNASKSSLNMVLIAGPTSNVTDPVTSGGVVDIPNYTTAGRHYVSSQTVVATAPLDAYLSIVGGGWNATTAITDILVGFGGQMVYAGATVSLYGVA